MNKKIYHLHDRICNDHYIGHKTFISSQNGAMITYRFKHTVGQFKFRLTFVENNNLCDVFIAGSETTHGVHEYTNDNINLQRICSLYIIQSPKWNKGNFFGMKITINEFDIGDKQTKTRVPYPFYVSSSVNVCFLFIFSDNLVFPPPKIVSWC